MDIELPSFQEDKGIKKSGCYVVNPELIGLNFKRALVPLRNIDYSLEIVNSLLNITLSQKYFNPTDQFLSVNYSLPIHPESSIYKFEAEFGNTKIEGIVKEKEEAKKEFEQAKIEGRQAAIGTLDPDSKDIMNFEIGNIPPQSEFNIKISMLQEMKISLNTFYQLIIPSTISPRFMNKINGEAKVSQHQIQKGESSGKPDFTWSFKIILKTTRKAIFFDSPTHNITLLNQNEWGTETLLVMEQAEIPNKDFKFLYTTEDFQLPSYVLGNTDTSSTIMLSFIPKFCDLNVSDAYKASVANKTYESDILTAKGDYVFLLDRSGSMSGTRINKAKEALILFLKSLPEDSYFNIISFGSGSQNMFVESQKYGADILHKAIDNVKIMEADLGGTEIYRPLEQLLESKIKEGYPRQIFLLTDGGVSNTQGVIKMVKKKTKYCRVHTIGIGNGASLDLITGCAESGKGKSVIITDDENPSEKIIELLESTLTPLISNINLKYENESQIESIVPNPKSIPYILKDDLINFYITYKGPLTEKQTFEFEYEDTVTKLPYKTTIHVDPLSTENQPEVNKMGHLKVLRSLEQSANDGILIEDQMFYVKVKDFRKEAIEYSVKHQVLSEFTAFICVGKELVDGQYQEFKNKGFQEIQVEQPKPIDILDRELESISSYLPSFSYSSNINAQLSRQSLKLDTLETKKAYHGEIKLCSARAPQQKSMNVFSGLGDAIGDAFSSVGSAIGNVFKSKKKEKSEPEISKANMCPPPPPQMKEAMRKEECEEVFMPANRDVFEEKEKEENKAEKLPEKSKNIDIANIVNLQLPNGSWNDKMLIEKLSSNGAEVKELINKLGNELVITQLVVLWIQKYHPEKQYALILKKAQGWIKKEIKDKLIDEALLGKLQLIDF